MTKVRRYPARRARVRVQGVLIGQFQLEDSILAYRPCETQRNASAIFLSGSFISTLPFGSLRPGLPSIYGKNQSPWATSQKRQDKQRTSASHNRLYIIPVDSASYGIVSCPAYRFLHQGVLEC
ncbi:hypothetical protein HZ326_18838 [Fusarium oxysporum f. sp. albedinis]|nr:Uncharacterized protein HZ326_19057 [Fusarium oxysporum f. sp. albedinis]KAJ0138208.1 hypothetical protein HZ326_18838 [Fusarium oxysporum f. sp. albedinis]